MYCHLCDESEVRLASTSRKKANRRIKGMEKRLLNTLPKEELEHEAELIRMAVRRGTERHLKNAPPLGKFSM